VEIVIITGVFVLHSKRELVLSRSHITPYPIPPHFPTTAYARKHKVDSLLHPSIPTSH